jgi:RNA polymerase sigma-70 factor (ECF subfamily)
VVGLTQTVPEYQAWITDLRQGDHAAFEAFVEQYHKVIIACCRSLGIDREAQEDVVNQTLLTAYEGLPRFGGRCALSTWVWTLAYRQGINHLRRNIRYRRHLHHIQETSPRESCYHPCPGLENREMQQYVLRALDQLPEIWSRTLHMYYWQSKTTAEIARILHVRKGTVRTYLFRARHRLRESLACH